MSSVEEVEAAAQQFNGYVSNKLSPKKKNQFFNVWMAYCFSEMKEMIEWIIDIWKWIGLEFIKIHFRTYLVPCFFLFKFSLLLMLDFTRTLRLTGRFHIY